MVGLSLDAWQLHDDAWLKLPRSQAAASQWFARACEGFEAEGNAAGVASCAAGALIAIASRHADYRGIAAWLARFDADALGPGASPLQRLRSEVAQMCISTLDPAIGLQRDRVVASAAAVYAALRSGLEMPADERIIYAKLLLDHLNLDNDPERFRHVAALLQATVDAPEASPYWVGVWSWRLAETHAKFGDAAAAEASRARAWSIAEANGIAELEYAMTAQDLAALLIRGDLATAARKVARMQALAPNVEATWQGHGLVYEARYRLIRNEPEAAQGLCERALRIYEDTELPDRERDLPRSVLAQSFVLLGQEERALELFDRIRPNQSGGQLAMLEANALATRAAQALRLQDPRLLALLRETLATARAINWYALFFPLPAIAARLFAAALEHDIEREFVVKAISSRQLAAPDATVEHWPWAIRIRALGAFVVERDGEAIVVEKKAQKKPLDLLRALVAAGGDGVPRERLAFALWPDPDADALAAFDVTLSRLRKLIDVDGSLLLVDGKLSLNRRIVWCDAIAFEALCDRLFTALAEAAVPETIEPIVASLFRLYRDKLFGDEPAAPWSVAARERLALRFHRAVADIGTWLEGRSQWRAAIDRYERGLAQQMLAEPLYRGLMRCHDALGERTEALLAFRRCRELLSVVLGVQPGDETEKLHRQIRGD
ncbi:MAG: BTAD domain-containing putative transcriptional regulator [Caldimonas sp.]